MSDSNIKLLNYIKHRPEFYEKKFFSFLGRRTYFKAYVGGTLESEFRWCIEKAFFHSTIRRLDCRVL